MSVVINGRLFYEPTPFQRRMHECTGRYPLAGGAAGPGKSYGLRQHGHIWSLNVPRFRTLLLRRKLVDLRRTHARDIVHEADALGAQWRSSTSGGGELFYPNGSILELGHCQHDDDMANYLSAEYDLILFDELVTFSEYMYLMIRSRCRTTKPNLQPRVFGASNPGVSPVSQAVPGLGATWCKRRWILRDVTTNEDATYHEADYPYLPATLEDNPHINQDEYRHNLRSLPPVLRQAYLEGSWDLYLGQFFPEFSRARHVQDLDHLVAKSAPRLCGLDWGFNPSPGVCLWAVMLPTGQLYVEDEFTFNGSSREKMNSDQVPGEILLRNKQRGISVQTYYADPAVFKPGGSHSGETIAETFARCGVTLSLAKNARAHGWAVLRNWLANRPHTDEPWLILSPRCQELANTLPQLMIAANKPEDCDSNGPDHWADTLRYILAGRPSPAEAAIATDPPPGTAGWMKQQILNAAGHRRGRRSLGAATRPRYATTY